MKVYPEFLLSPDAFPMVWGRFEASMGVAKKRPSSRHRIFLKALRASQGYFERWRFFVFFSSEDTPGFPAGIL